MKVYNFNDDEVEELDYEEEKTKKRPSKAKEEPEEEVNIVKEIISLLIYVVCIFIAVFVIIKFVGQRTIVSGSSMENTLSNGDNLIVDKFTYNFIRDPERFDVIIFPYKYEEKTCYIKRVIGLPGETVFIDADGTIYVNGERLQESYGKDVILNAGLASETIMLGLDEYFVLGDNRNNSTDSRFENVGNIKREDIVGRAWVRIYPFDEISFVEKL